MPPPDQPPAPNPAPPPPPGRGADPDTSGFVARVWQGQMPTADRLVSMWSARMSRDLSAGDDPPLADLLACDAEIRAARKLDARLETYLAEYPPLARDTEACRAILMNEFAGLRGPALVAARERVARSAPALASHAKAVADLCEAMSSDDEEPGAGTELGKYKLLSRIGAGAFGAVWLAEDKELGRSVALKLLHQAAGGAVLRRVMAEAQAAAALDHPNVVKIYAAGRLPDGRGYIDSQLVADAAPTREDPRRVIVGLALDQLEGKARQPRDAAGLIERVARGVAAAHARGIVHRDIKPANIIVTPSGTPMLADFGLSALASEAMTAGGGGPDRSIATGRVTGTPAFMSPEQARGERATPASDVYSLGATLRYLLTGELPVRPSGRYSPDARADVLQQLRGGEIPRLEPVRGSLPLTLARICDRAMAAELPSRYVSADHFADDLAAWLAHRPAAAGREGALGRWRLWCRRNVAAVTVGVIAVLAMAFVAQQSVLRIIDERDKAVKAEGETGQARDAALRRSQEAQTAREAAEASEKKALRKSKEAQEARDVAEGVNRFMQDALLAAQADLGGRDITMYDAIVAAADRVDATVEKGSLVEGGVRHVIGRVLATMGDFQRAEANLKRSLEVRRTLLSPTNLDLLYTEFAIAEMLMFSNRHAEADAVVTPLEKRSAEALGNDHYLTLSIRDVLAEIRLAQGRLPEAEALIKGNIAARAAMDRPEELKIADGETFLGKLAKATGAKDQAVEHFRTAVALRLKIVGEQDLSTVAAKSDLGSVLAELGNVAECEPLQREAYQTLLAKLGPRHVNTLDAGYNLAWMLLTKKKAPEESLALTTVLSADALARLGEGNITTVRTSLLHGRALHASGKHAQAEPVLRSAAERAAKLGREGVALDAVASRTLAECLDKLGKAEEAAVWKERGERKVKEARGG